MHSTGEVYDSWTDFTDGITQQKEKRGHSETANDRRDVLLHEGETADTSKSVTTPKPVTTRSDKHQTKRQSVEGETVTTKKPINQEATRKHDTLRESAISKSCTEHPKADIRTEIPTQQQNTKDLFCANEKPRDAVEIKKRILSSKVCIVVGCPTFGEILCASKLQLNICELRQRSGEYIACIHRVTDFDQKKIDCVKKKYGTELPIFGTAPGDKRNIADVLGAHVFSFSGDPYARVYDVCNTDDWTGVSVLSIDIDMNIELWKDEFCEGACTTPGNTQKDSGSSNTSGSSTSEVSKDFKDRGTFIPFRGSVSVIGPTGPCCQGCLCLTYPECTMASENPTRSGITDRVCTCCVPKTIALGECTPVRCTIPSIDDAKQPTLRKRKVWSKEKNMVITVDEKSKDKQDDGDSQAGKQQQQKHSHVVKSWSQPIRESTRKTSRSSSSEKEKIASTNETPESVSDEEHIPEQQQQQTTTHKTGYDSSTRTQEQDQPSQYVNVLVFVPGCRYAIERTFPSRIVKEMASRIPREKWRETSDGMCVSITNVSAYGGTVPRSKKSTKPTKKTAGSTHSKLAVVLPNAQKPCSSTRTSYCSENHKELDHALNRLVRIAIGSIEIDGNNVDDTIDSAIERWKTMLDTDNVYQGIYIAICADAESVRIIEHDSVTRKSSITSTKKMKFTQFVISNATYSRCRSVYKALCTPTLFDPSPVIINVYRDEVDFPESRTPPKGTTSKVTTRSSDHSHIMKIDDNDNGRSSEKRSEVISDALGEPLTSDTLLCLVYYLRDTAEYGVDQMLRNITKKGDRDEFDDGKSEQYDGILRKLFYIAGPCRHINGWNAGLKALSVSTTAASISNKFAALALSMDCSVLDASRHPSPFVGAWWDRKVESLLYDS